MINMRTISASRLLSPNIDASIRNARIGMWASADQFEHEVHRLRHRVPRIELHLEILGGLHQRDEFGRDADEVVVGLRKILVNLEDGASAVAPVDGSIDDQGSPLRV